MNYNGPEAVQRIDKLSRLYLNEKLLSVAQDLYLNPSFSWWSGGGAFGKHHFGSGGLAQHTFEVITLCLNNAETVGVTGDIELQTLFLAALYHDAGKMSDYEKDPATNEWRYALHHSRVHHLVKSAIIWSKVADQYEIDYEMNNEVTHCIVSHHGCREWGSPVSPKTKLAWILHLSDSISARVNES